MSDEIQRSLGRIEGKLDMMLETQEAHGERLNNLDALKNKFYGIVSAVAVVAGAAGAFVKTAVASLIHGGQP